VKGEIEPLSGLFARYIKCSNKMKEIKLNLGFVAIIDDDDYPNISLNKWFIDFKGNVTYAVRNEMTLGKSRKIYMHRVVMGARKGQVVDHLDYNGLNNQKNNLRICTHGQNLQHHYSAWGELPYIGVVRKREKFHARIVFNKERFCLGCYFTMEEAARVYDRKAIELYGEFAYLNFPEEKEDRLKELGLL
jgi:hypothetical protein